MIFNCFSADCTNSSELKQAVGCLRVRADVNGFKKPNKVGKDIHDFYFTEDKVIARGDPLTDKADIDDNWTKGYKILSTGKL